MSPPPSSTSSNPFLALPGEIINRIFIDYIGEYLLLGVPVKTAELLDLLLVDKVFSSIARRLRKKVAMAQVTEYMGKTQ